MLVAKIGLLAQSILVNRIRRHEAHSMLLDDLIAAVVQLSDRSIGHFGVVHLGTVTRKNPGQGFSRTQTL